MKLQAFSYGVGIFAAIASVADAKGVPYEKIHFSRKFVPGSFIAEFDEGVNKGPTFLAHFKRRDAPNITVLQNFQSDIFTGASFHVDSDFTKNSLLEAPGVIRLWPVSLIPHPKLLKGYKPNGQIQAVAPQHDTMHNLTGVTEVHEKLKIFGKGVKVGVIDSGLYYKHPAFGVNGKPGCYKKPGCRVQYGYDLVGDDYSSTNPITKPDGDPLDECSSDSHGTHVAGIIGADASNIKGKFKPAFPFVGVAPQATLGAYRVFGCKADFTSDDLVTQAILLAAKDGMDIINLSLGGGSAWHEEFQNVIVQRVTAKGHIVLGAMGNDGGTGAWVGGNPGLAESGFGVASVDNIATLEYIIKDNSGKIYGYSLASAYSKPFPNIKAKIIVNNPAATPETTLDDGCKPLTFKAKGAVVLFQQGSACGSKDRCANAYAAGAAGCLIYANAPGGVNILGDERIPGGSLSQTDGKTIVAIVKGNAAAIFTFSDKQASFVSETSGTPSSFTSWAMDPELQIKPNIAGVGGNVYSTLSPKASGGTGYGSYSGTSMATPYMAGSIALYISSKGKANFKMMKTKFQNSARPTFSFGQEWYASVAQQGAGLVNVLNTIKSKTLVVPSEIALNDTVNMKKSYSFRIQNKYSKGITYHLSHEPAATVYNKDVGSDMLLDHPVENAEYATVSFSKKKVYIAAGKSKVITVTFKAPKASDPKRIPIFSGYLAATPQVKGAFGSRITYAGLKGSWGDAPIFSKVNTLGSRVNGLYDSISSTKPVKKGAIINLTAKPAVALLVLSTPTRLVYADVVAASGKKSLGYLVSADGSALYNDYAGRNSQTQGQSSTPYTAFSWQGLVTPTPTGKTTSKLPAGQYKVRFFGLKHFGNPDKLSDYEVHESSVFTIAY